MTMERLFEEHSESDQRNFAELKQEMKELKKEFRELREEMTKSKGFIGGVIFVVSCLFAAVGFMVSWLK